jgi:hypothetical protein
VRSILLPAALMLLAASHGANASDLRYTLQSPAFGGFNRGLLEYEQLEKGLRQQRAAEAERRAREAAGRTGVDVNQQFVNAIVAQLTSLVARDIATRIASTGDGDAGTISSGDTNITFVNSDGQLSVVITTPTGTTNITVPSGI